MALELNGQVTAIVIGLADKVVRFEPAAALPVAALEGIFTLLQEVGLVEVEPRADDAAILRDRATEEAAGAAAAAASAATSATVRERGRK